MGEGIGNFLGSICFCECPLICKPQCVGTEVNPTWMLYKVSDINKYLATVFSCCPQKDKVFHCMSNELSKKRERKRERKNKLQSKQKPLEQTNTNIVNRLEI
uniref:Uncharacterized protein n=1 Tax=Micrurus corallinus TaxID=54390 RepID=A0A2D4GKK9_MICCO